MTKLPSQTLLLSSFPDMLGTEEVRLLAELGFIAARRGLHKEAQAIFVALKQLRPGRAVPIIGLAVDAFYRGKFQEAVQILESELKQSSEEAQTLAGFRVFALCLAGYRTVGCSSAKNLDFAQMDSELATLVQLCL